MVKLIIYFIKEIDEFFLKEENIIINENDKINENEENNEDDKNNEKDKIKENDNKIKYLIHQKIISF